jgi:hypothetical protein
VVDIKTAVANAMDFAKVSLGPERTIGLRLEEIESSSLKGKAVWLITLSTEIHRPGSPVAWARASGLAIGADPEREYKVFTVAKDGGEVLSMKMRLLAVPN